MTKRFLIDLAYTDDELAAFSRIAWSFWALGLSPRTLISAALGMKSLIWKSYNGLRVSDSGAAWQNTFNDG